ncbi:MAG: potassium/proton antiporter [Phycisphaerae bacterium]|nr:potassium/proton antiporter [Gemmatimonadaceae bacterium]
MFLATFGALLVLSVIFSRASVRTGIPLTLVFLGIGVLAGSEGVGRIAFEDYGLAFRLGSVALAFILFDGGLNTRWSHVRHVLAPAGALATIGVLVTGSIVAGGCRLLGLDWPEACLIGAIVSSTDAAAVFSVLRASGVHLKKRVGLTLELESGINDPLAVILTMLVIQFIMDRENASAVAGLLSVLQEGVVGGVIGVVIGVGARRMLVRYPLRPSGLYPAFTVGVACLAYAVPTVLHGSGFLGVYVAGIALGEGNLPYRNSMIRVHDALAWVCQIGMFLVLGLLAFPSRLVSAAPIGLSVALLLAFVARPVAVALCLLPFRYKPQEVAYVGWVGLRGAVPIVLATLPVLYNVPGAARVFDVVFFIVLINAALQGTSVPWVTRKLKVESAEPAAPSAVLEIEGQHAFSTLIHSYHVDEALSVAGPHLTEIPIPGDSAVMMIVRGKQLIAPRGDTELTPGDHVYLLVAPEDTAFVQLLFGQPEGE